MGAACKSGSQLLDSSAARRPYISVCVYIYYLEEKIFSFLSARVGSYWRFFSLAPPDCEDSLRRMVWTMGMDGWLVTGGNCRGRWSWTGRDAAPRSYR